MMDDVNLWLGVRAWSADDRRNGFRVGFGSPIDYLKRLVPFTKQTDDFFMIVGRKFLIVP
jgi:hypothetical protein